MSAPLECVPVIANHFPESWPGLSRPSTSCLLKSRKKDVDAREDGVPAALRGGESLRGHDGGGAMPSHRNHWRSLRFDRPPPVNPESCDLYHCTGPIEAVISAGIHQLGA